MGIDMTFVLRNYPPQRIFSAMDLNIDYDETHPRRYKRPDWFGVWGLSIVPGARIALGAVGRKPRGRRSLVVALLRSLARVDSDSYGTGTTGERTGTRTN